MYIQDKNEIYFRLIKCAHNYNFTIIIIAYQVEKEFNMELLILSCTMFLLLTIHAYCMPIKKSVERLEKASSIVPFCDEDIARTL